MKNSILIISGGTGGHVIPAEILFKYINSKNENIYFLTDQRGYEYVKDKKNSKIFQIKASHFSGNLTFKLNALIKFIMGFFFFI